MSDVIITTSTETEVIETVVEDCVISTEVVTHVIETAAEQGPPGRNGLDGVNISSAPNNQLSMKDDGLYAPPATWSLKEW